jgi:hypothetical protein
VVTKKLIEVTAVSATKPNSETRGGAADASAKTAK